MKYVQFSDNKKTNIVSVFDCPQDADVHTNQGEVEDDDSRYLTYKNSLPFGFRPDENS